MDLPLTCLGSHYLSGGALLLGETGHASPCDGPFRAQILSAGPISTAESGVSATFRSGPGLQAAVFDEIFLATGNLDDALGTYFFGYVLAGVTVAWRRFRRR